MKTPRILFAPCLWLAVVCSSSANLAAQGTTAFTYQGRLNQNGSPATGLYDLRFVIYDALVGGSGAGGPVTNAAVAVTNGLFTVTLDFGSSVFTGPARWLEIGARINGSVSPHTALTPRQPVTPAPYALHAANADTVATVPWSSITGVPLVVMSNMIGSVGNQPLELKVNGQRALRLEPTRSNDTVNVLGGSSVNSIASNVISATIAGGGTPSFNDGPRPNYIGSDFGTIGGGAGNYIGTNSNSGTIAGGFGQYISDNTFDGTISGGSFNWIGVNSWWATIGGGTGNWVLEGSGASAIAGGAGNGISTNSGYSAIGGGLNNFIQTGAGLSSIGGGWLNLIQDGADQSVIAGGNAGHILSGARESFIGGGFANNIGTNAGGSVIGGGIGNGIQNDSIFSFIGSGYGNSIGANAPDSAIVGGDSNSIQPNASHASIVGGTGNTVSGGGAFVGGGIVNRAEHFDAVVAGGGGNVASGYRSFIGGGEGNVISNTGSYAAIGGGTSNVVRGIGATIAGGQGNQVMNQVGTVGGGRQNTNTGNYATVAGGYQNTVSNSYSTVGGGFQNIAGGNFNNSGDSATVAGGYQNLALGNNAFVGGGFANYARGDNSTIAGGWLHTNQTGFGFIGGGQQNLLELFSRFSVVGGGDNNSVRSNSLYTVISGGQLNRIGTNASYATIPGGFSNEVTATHGFAAGRRAKANHPGAFVWADSIDANFASAATNQFSVRASGGVRLETGGAGVIVDGLGVLAGSVNASQITDGAVTTAKIADGAIVNLDISASAAIADTKLATISTAGKVANSALSSSVSLLGQTIESAEISDGTIGPADLDLTAFNPTFWRTTGNGGTTPGTQFVGTTDNQPLTVKVNGVTALRIDPTATAPNIVGGLAGFRPTVIGTNVRGAVVAGGNAPAGPVNGVGGGDFHAVFDSDGAIGGGFGNKVGTDNGNPDDAPFATVAGGVFNGAAGYAATVAGGDANLAGGPRSSVGGGAGNWALGTDAFVGGGDNNRAHSSHSTIGGGQNNIATNAHSAVAGGGWNTASGISSFIGGGGGDTFGGPWTNTASGNWSAILGGWYNTASGYSSAIGGGSGNVAAGTYATIPGGNGNRASGDYSFAAGRAANAAHAGAFVWADSQFADFASTANNQFLIRASGGVGVGTANPASALHVVGTVTATAFNPPSDRNLKENFESVSPREVLDKVAAMPISRWNFIGDAATPHVGPMAQDFHAAFGLGTDDKHIATVDADGVALAAIQGLNAKLEEELRAKDARIAELERRLVGIEKLLATGAPK